MLRYFFKSLYRVLFFNIYINIKENTIYIIYIVTWKLLWKLIRTTLKRVTMFFDGGRKMNKQQKIKRGQAFEI